MLARSSAGGLPSIPILAALALLLTGCGASPAAPATTAISSTATVPATSRVLPPHGLDAGAVPADLATVDGARVPAWLYRSQVNFRLALREAPATPGGAMVSLPPEQVRAIERSSLEAVIESTMLVRYGELHGWVPTPARVEDNYQLVVARRGGSEASQRQVQSEFLTVEQDREVARNKLVTQQVLDHFLAGLHQPVGIVLYRMVLARTPAAAAWIRALLLHTGRWVHIARAYSLDPIGRSLGGEQPSLAPGPAGTFAGAVSSLPPGALSEPIRAPGGWAVVQVLRRLPGRDLLAGDLARYRAWVLDLRRRAQVHSALPLSPG